MASRKEVRHLNEMADLIMKEKRINKVRLVMGARISISYYEKLKPFLEELYGNRIRYNREEKMWEAIETEQVSS